MSRFIALHCGDETTALLADHPNAFLLLTQIAMRAKWKSCPVTRLNAGQAFIGDWQQAGLHSEMVYRHAKDVLFKCGIATFKGTNKGTVATLMNSTIFSISQTSNNGQATRLQQTNSEIATDKQRAGSKQNQGMQGKCDEPTTDKKQNSNRPTTTNHTDTQNTQPLFALDGASSIPVPSVSWNSSNGFTGITDKDRREWSEAFPAVDISRQLAAAHLWLKSNPAKKKKNIRRFITGWLTRQQEQGGDIRSNPIINEPAAGVTIQGRTFKP